MSQSLITININAERFFEKFISVSKSGTRGITYLVRNIYRNVLPYNNSDNEIAKQDRCLNYAYMLFFGFMLKTSMSNGLDFCRPSYLKTATAIMSIPAVALMCYNGRNIPPVLIGYFAAKYHPKFMI